MIVKVGGKWISPEHVTQVGDTYAGRCHLFFGPEQRVEVNCTQAEAVEEINAALAPQRYITGADTEINLLNSMQSDQVWALPDRTTITSEQVREAVLADGRNVFLDVDDVDQIVAAVGRLLGIPL
jgi:hypothetical protein